MLVTLFGIVTLVSNSQLAKADSPMLVTLPGMVYAPEKPPGHCIMAVMPLSNKTPDASLE